VTLSFRFSIPQQSQVILLKEGTETLQGKAQMVSNINACTAVVDTVRTTLGPPRHGQARPGAESGSHFFQC